MIQASSAVRLPDRATLERAIARRAPLASRADTTAYRLLNGAADGAPGVAVDQHGGLLVLHLQGPTGRAERLAADLLRLVPEARSVYVKVHPQQASHLTEEQRAALAPGTPVAGSVVVEELVTEQGLRFEIRPDAGLSVGLFLDMREVRGWVRSVAAGRRVLNLFAYTCAFGVYAQAGGAERVLNLDLSRPYLEWGQANFRANGLEPVTRDFVYGDALDWLGRFARRGEQFDLVILDPPSFSTTRGRRLSVEASYPGLAAACARVVAPGGILLAATNNAGVSARRFEAQLASGLYEAGRSFRPVGAWSEPALDFPVASGVAPYLKVRALEIAAP